MEFKSATVPFFGHDDELAALKTALQLTVRNKARMEVLHVAPDITTDISTYPLGYAISAEDAAQAAYSISHLWPAERNVALRKFEMAAAEEKANIESADEPAKNPAALFTSITGYAESVVAHRARVTDIAIMTRPQAEISGPSRDAAYGALLGSGHPVLFVPPGTAAHVIRERAIIAWNGSAENARAVALALPMLRRTKVWIFCAREQGKPEPRISATMLRRYLADHGIAAEHLEPEASAAGVAETLEKSARALEALVVMGAYSHNRLRETIFGGVTDTLLHRATVPVLMAH